MASSGFVVGASLFGILLAAPLRLQTQWTQVPGTMADRHGHAMVYDHARREVVIFGGNTSFGSRNDTWVFQNRQWRQRSPATSPPARHQHGMAYDPVRRRVVVFGGATDLANGLNDTWEWDGQNWQQAQPVNSPPARFNVAMAYDSVRSRIVLYGGTPFAQPTLYDTWEWDGVDWRNMTPSSNVSVFGGVMATDFGFGGSAALFAGRSSANQGDLYRWIGARWIHFGSVAMTGRIWTAMTYDLARNRLVLFGGTDGGGAVAYNDTWENEGTVWRTRTTPASPPVRYWHAMAYDADAGEVVMYGGRVQPTRLTDTWVYGPVLPASFTPFGSACPGSAGTPELGASGLPWLGDALTLSMRNLPASAAGVLFLGGSDAQWGALALPLPLAGIGMPGCDLLASPDLALPFVASNGIGSVPLQVCQCPELLGQSVFQQAVVRDAAANALGLTVTNGGRLRIGGR